MEKGYIWRKDIYKVETYPNTQSGDIYKEETYMERIYRKEIYIER